MNEKQSIQREISNNQGVGCSHLETIKRAPTASEIKKAHKAGCAECIKMGSTWLHLRMCLECGHTACCDSSPNKHARAHFNHTSHPIVRSIEPKEDWGACFVDTEASLDFSPTGITTLEELNA